MSGNGRAPRMAWTTPALIAGLVAIFIAERLLIEGTGRVTLNAIGAALLLLPLLGRLVRRARLSDAAARAAESRVMLGYLAAIAAVVLYALQTPEGAELAGLSLEGNPTPRWPSMVSAIWPVVLLLGLLPAIFIDLSRSAAGGADAVDRRRVSASGMAGLGIALVAGWLFFANYALNENNRRWDFSYFKTSSPGEATLNIVDTLEEPFDIILFFPQVNEVREELVQYFSVLDSASPLVNVRTLDINLYPEEAKRFRVSAEGMVGLGYSEKTKSMRFSTELKRARKDLRTLDADFQKQLLALIAPDRVAYLTAGHGERSTTRPSRDAEDQRPSVKLFQELLKSLNFKVRDLGLHDGLGSEVPQDAALVTIIDPTQPFLPSEIRALNEYVQRGGSVLLALDTDMDPSIADLLAPYGKTYDPTPLANVKYHWKQNYQRSDHYNLVTNRYSSHDSVQTLSRYSQRLAIGVMGAGSFEDLPREERPEELAGKAIITVRSMSQTFADKTGNGIYDQGLERQKTFTLGLAVEVDVPPEESADGEEPAEKEGRIFAFADAEVFADAMIGNQPLAVLTGDVLKWLVQEEELSGETNTEEDVKIVHSASEDKRWFYGTIFAIPLLVFGIGMVTTRRVRRRRA